MQSSFLLTGFAKIYHYYVVGVYENSFVTNDELFVPRSVGVHAFGDVHVGIAYFHEMSPHSYELIFAWICRLKFGEKKADTATLSI